MFTVYERDVHQSNGLVWLDGKKLHVTAYKHPVREGRVCIRFSREDMILTQYVCEQKFDVSISGLVAEYIVAIDVTRVRFPADASCCPSAADTLHGRHAHTQRAGR